MTYCPILLFTYKKVEPLRLTIAALRANDLAKHSELYIFSDGAKNLKDAAQVAEVRRFLKTVDGFKSVSIREEPTNKGLATSILEGVSELFQQYKAVIVLEDDLVTSTNFLDFMNEALKEYEANAKIHSISGYTVPMKVPAGYFYDNYFTRRATSWGWATWKDRWERVDWSVSDYEQFSGNPEEKKTFNAMGSDMSSMLAKQMNGTINSWAIRWCYHQFKYDLFTAFPIISKISNIGFGAGATHTKGSKNRYATPLDSSGKKKFDFLQKIDLDPYFINQFRSYYSLYTRGYYKIRAILGI